MREIKFRARHTRTGEWWYGSSETVYHSYKQYRVYHLTEFWGFIRKGILDAKTVGEYTGLKDKNEVEIYEGDIVKYTRYQWKEYGHPQHNTDLITYYKITWEENDCAFKVDNKSMTGSMRFKDSRATKNEIEVIGNIYANPELPEAVNAA